MVDVGPGTIGRDAGGDLADAQVAMWLGEVAGVDSEPRHISLAVTVTTDGDVATLRAAVDAVIRRHDSLRTRFVDAPNLAALVEHEADVPLAVEDATGWDDHRIAARLEQHHRQLFDLAHAPLCRVLVLDHGDRRYTLLFTVHHIVSDIWSNAVIGAELVEAFGSASAGGPVELGTGPSYAEFVRAEQDFVTSERGDRARAHWGALFAHVAPFAIGGTPSCERGSSVTPVVVPDALWARLRDVGDSLGVPLRSVVQAAYAVLLARLGSTVPVHLVEFKANRSLRTGRAVGCFTNAVLRAWSIDAATTTRALILDTRRQELEGRPFERYPFARLCRDESVRPGPGLFEAAFAWQKTSRAVEPGIVSALVSGADGVSHRVGEFDVAPHPATPRSAPAPLVLAGTVTGSDVTLVLEHRRDVIDDDEANSLAQRLVNVLSAIVDDPDVCARSIDVTTADERERHAAAWAAADARARTEPTVMELFDSRCRAAPDSVAVSVLGATPVDGAPGPSSDTSRTTWTYAELDELSRRLARAIAASGVERGDTVAICVPRSGAMVAAVLATWRCRAAFVPIDPALPAARIGMMLDDGRVRAVVTAGGLWSRTVPAGHGPDLVIDLDDIPEGAAPSMPAPELPATEFPAPADLAYVMFTSGSTGRPKGVAVEHGSLANQIASIVSEPGIVGDDVVLASTTFVFDPSLIEQIAPLTVGAAVLMLPDGAERDPDLVLQALDRATVAQATPAFWRMVVSTGWRGNRRLSAWSGGEALAPRVARELIGRTRAVWNLYGPTETTVWSTTWKVTLDDVEAVRVPIGTPVAGARLYVLDEAGAHVPDGVVGELWIGGTSVAPGYIGRPDLTAERFIPDPFRPGGRMYRTGDRVRRRRDSALEYHGRHDDQVKIRGHRIELGEVTAALTQLPVVASAAAAVHGVDDDARLVGYVVASPGVDVDGADVRTRLRAVLPDVMVPGAIVQLDELPLTSNGKVDRLRLPPPATADTGSGPAQVGATERMISEIWCEELGLPAVNRDQSVFDLGANSLHVVRVITAVRRRTGRRLPLWLFHAAPSVSELAASIDRDGWLAPWTSMIELRREGDRRPLFYVAPFVVSALSFRELSVRVGADQPFYVFQPQGLTDVDAAVHTTVEEMAAHYIAEMRTVQPVGPYRLAGHCTGGWVALEMARQLEAAHEEVERLIVVDVEPPSVDRPRPRATQYIASRVALYVRQRRTWAALRWRVQLVVAASLGRLIGSAETKRMASVRFAHHQAHRAYRGGRFSGGVTLIRSSEWAGLDDKRWHERWGELVDGDFEVDEVPGTHAELLVGNSVDGLGAVLRTLLDVSSGRSR